MYVDGPDSDNEKIVLLFSFYIVFGNCPAFQINRMNTVKYFVLFCDKEGRLKTTCLFHLEPTRRSMQCIMYWYLYFRNYFIDLELIV